MHLLFLLECSADRQSLQFRILADRQSLQFRMFGRQVTCYGKDSFRWFLSVTAKVRNNYGAPIGNARKEWSVWEGIRLR